MATYIVSFSIVVVLLKAKEKVKENQQWALEYVAIVLLCLLAGLRSINVGTDTGLYLQPCIRAAISADSYQDFVSASWHDGWMTLKVSNYEVLFLITVYIVAKLFHSIWVVQLVLQLLIVTPVYIVLKRRKEVPLWFGMLVYMLVFFNLSLNIIRQAIAMSAVLLSTQLWTENKKKSSIVALVIGSLFHMSGWIGLLVILIYSFVEKEHNKVIRILGLQVDVRYGNMLITVMAGLFVLLFANVLTNLLKGTFFSRFVGYITGDVRFMPNQLIKLLPPLVMMIYNVKQMEQQTSQSRFYLTMILLSLILLQFTSVNAFGGRVAEYFMYFGVLSYPTACRKNRKTGLLTVIMIGYLVFYWLYYYGFGNSGETIPYEMLY